MSEPKVNEKKVVGRSVAIALGIICIILVAGLAGTLIVLNGANTQITSLQSQMNNLANIVNLANSTVWVNNQTVSEPAAGLGIAWCDLNFSTNYAGDVIVNVLSANASVGSRNLLFMERLLCLSPQL